ncbi:MAG: endopolygalacturonase [Chitinivibrionales bacterium]|nr:endopolygalacturonase [Chitinivibrionales bacterium]
MISVDRVFPDDSGVVDVARPPYNARGDGITDDTGAIQGALDDNPDGRAIIYLPRGIYRVSDTLRWPAGEPGHAQKNTILQGQNKEYTVIKLIDSCEGFCDADNPRAVIWTGKAPAQRFRNAVRNLTIDTGKGNYGAIGAQFMTNNQGGMYHVTIRSGDGSGVIGLDMSYSDEIGPLLIKHVGIEGFNYGVKIKYSVDSMTFEHVALEGQRVCGIYNDGQCVSIRKLFSKNSVPVIINKPGTGMITLVDSEFSGGKGAGLHDAVINEASLFARNVFVDAYRNSIVSRVEKPVAVSDTYIKEFVSHEIKTLFPTSEKSLNLTVKETPDIPWDQPDQWVSPTHFGAKPGDSEDISSAIQQAIDSGKSTLYFPRGVYRIEKPLLIRGNIQRIIGCEAFLDVPSMDTPVFTLVDGTAPVVVFERFESNFEPTIFLTNKSSRTLIIRSCCNVTGHFAGGGEIFIEDVCSNPVTFWKFAGCKVWARQFNPEPVGTHVVNDGGSLWILGFKTERGGVLLETKNGGATEILGAFAYSTSKKEDAPAFVNNESSLSFTAGEACFGPRTPFCRVVEETRSGRPKVLKRDMVPSRCNGYMVSLYTGRSERDS